MTRAERRRQERAAARCKRLVPDNYGVLAAWCAGAEDLAEANQRAHDALIRLMGDRRRGPVEFVSHAGAKAEQMLGVLQGDPGSPVLADHYRRIGAHLREYGGLLVVAMAPGEVQA